MALSEDDDVIEALAADAAEEAFTGGVHKRRAFGGLQNANARAFGDAVKLAAELGVAITDDELGAFAERRELPQLLGSPGLAGLAGDSDVDDLLGVYVHDEEREQWPEPDVMDLQKIAGPDGVVGEKGLPALPVSCWPDGEDVPLDGALGDSNAELE